MILHSRDKKASCELMRHSTSFDLSLDWGGDTTVAPHVLRRGAINLAITSFTLVCVGKGKTVAAIPGANNFAPIAGLTFGAGQDDTYTIYAPQNAPSQNTFLDASNVNRGFGLSGQDLGAGKFVLANRANTDWHILGVNCKSTNDNYLFCEGAFSEAFSSTRVSNLYTISAPYFLLGREIAATGWSQMKLGGLWVFSPALSDQELRDFYAMLKFGRGYAVSRKNLLCWWLGRRSGAQYSALTAYVDDTTVRATIPDLSGRGMDGSLYGRNASTNWDTVFKSGASTDDPGIYIPRVWYDSNLEYDGANNYTKSMLKLTYDGVAFS